MAIYFFSIANKISDNMPSKTLLIGNGTKKLFEVFWINPIEMVNGRNKIKFYTYSYDIFPFKVQLKLYYDNNVKTILTFVTLPQKLQEWSYLTYDNIPQNVIDFTAKILPK